MKPIVTTLFCLLLYTSNAQYKLTYKITLGEDNEWQTIPENFELNLSGYKLEVVNSSKRVIHTWEIKEAYQAEFNDLEDERTYRFGGLNFSGKNIIIEISYGRSYGMKISATSDIHNLRKAVLYGNMFILDAVPENVINEAYVKLRGKNF